MKNSLIITLAQIFDNVGANTVGIEDAYKIYKIKSELRKAQKAIREKANEFSKEVFADDAEAKLAGDPKAEKSPELKEKIRKFNDLYKKLLDDETEINIKRVSFESWHAFTKENELKLGLFEVELEGVLFNGMDEEEKE